MAIRTAILQKSAAGIVQFSTPDWSFHSADGTTYNRESYVRRTEDLFAKISIETLDTRIEKIDLAAPDHAQVTLTQIMVRTEASPQGPQRIRLTYSEQQAWVRLGSGWAIQQVTVVAPTVRETL